MKLKVLIISEKLPASCLRKNDYLRGTLYLPDIIFYLGLKLKNNVVVVSMLTACLLGACHSSDEDKSNNKKSAKNFSVEEPVFLDHRVFLNSSYVAPGSPHAEYKLSAFDLNTTRLLWDSVLPGSPRPYKFVIGHLLIVQVDISGSESLLIQIDISTGKQIGQFEVEGKLETSLGEYGILRDD